MNSNFYESAFPQLWHIKRTLTFLIAHFLYGRLEAKSRIYHKNTTYKKEKFELVSIIYKLIVSIFNK